MTEREYLKIYHKYPFTTSAPYEGQEEDKQAITEYNKELCEKYPFLIPRNVWTGKLDEDYNYAFTILDDMPDGWRIAFGLQMMEEIKQAILNSPIPEFIDEYMVMQVKEKYGTLRWYDGGAPMEVHEVTNKYEKISEYTCITCGEPAKYISRGWISPFCEKCAHEMMIADRYTKDTDTLEDHFEPIRTKSEKRRIDIQSED